MILVYSPLGIYLSFMPLVKAESVLIGNGRVLAAGDYERLARLPSVKEELVSKKPLGPGFIDAHLHLDSLGFELYSEKLVVDNIRSLIESLKNKEPMVGGWLLPGRVDPSKLKENRLPTRLELDEISREKPILIIHQSGHMGALNTKGLKMVLEVMGKRSEIDYERGYVYETSLWGILDFIRRTATDKDLEEFFERAYELLREKGISAIGLAGIRMREFELLLSFYKENVTRVRTYVYLLADEVLSRWREVKKLLDTSLPERLRLNGLKILIDGALGPRTALLSEDYSDAPGVKGLKNVSPEFMVEALTLAEEHELQLAMHAIGDAALDMALDVLEKSRNPGIHRIEHASLVRDDQLEMIARWKPLLVVQPRFIISDKWILSRLGVERAKWVYRFKTLRKLTTVAFSTDAPVEPVDPFETIYAAVTRGLRDNVDYGYDHMYEAYTLIEALDAYTRGGSLALRDERLGCLLPGCYADIVEYSNDPLRVSDVTEIRYLSARLIPL